MSFVIAAECQQFACRWVSKEDLACAVTASKDTAAYGALVLKQMRHAFWPLQHDSLISLLSVAGEASTAPGLDFLHSSRLGNCTSSHQDVGYFAKSLVFKVVATMYQ